METVDLLIVIFAVVALVGSAAGTILYEGPVGERDYDVTFTTTTGAQLASPSPQTQQGSAGPQGSAALNFDIAVPITQPNVLALDFAVSVTSDRSLPVPRAGNGIDIEARLATPDGNDTGQVELASMTGTATSAALTLTAPAGSLAMTPADTTVSATNITRAEIVAMENFTAENATGTWTVSVTVTLNQNSAPTGEGITVAVVANGDYYEIDVTADTAPISGVA